MFITNYPKEVNISTFNVSFVVKSYYETPVSVNTSLYINDVLEDSKILYLVPKQEKLEYFTISLSEKDQYKIKIALLPITKPKQIPSLYHLR